MNKDIETKPCACIFTKREFDKLNFLIRNVFQRFCIYLQPEDVNFYYEKSGEFGRVKVITSPIKVIPAIFQECHIEGSGETNQLLFKNLKDNEECISLPMCFSYRYTHYDGGSNGCDLTYLDFRLFRHSFDREDDSEYEPDWRVILQ